jgi:hypothetical protein
MDELHDKIIKNATYATGNVAIYGRFDTEAARTRAIVTEAFWCAFGNGLITAVPQEQWPVYLALDPPYDPTEKFWERGSSE